MITFKDKDIAQALENVKAGLTYHGLPVPEVISTLKDRVIFVYDPILIALLVKKPEEFHEWDFVSNHGETAIRGWRECVALCSMQVIEHTDAIEVDYDLCNPDFGAAPAFGHFVECLWPGKTNPRKVMTGLRKRGIEVEEV